ncbi:UNVERIFIED_CONTAM: hypothetical protein PYX00_005072 [Menopon gallinae]|uniref:NLE domain-containing protein n=1 Tax=Menopon gallinae TaxID=328185 RepID=A0AAW2HPS9_9NEOP
MTSKRVLSRLKSESGEVLKELLDLPLDVNVSQLQRMCNALLNQDEGIPYLFFVNDREISDTLEKTLATGDYSSEQVLEIVYQQQAVFKVRPVTRCTSSLPGHAESVLTVRFSPDSKHLASGSGDTTVRLWDLDTQTPLLSLTGHKNWVLCLEWSPDSSKIASGDKNGHIIVWTPEGRQLGKTLISHKQWITSLCWEPYHMNPECRLLASGSKDGDIRIWDVLQGQTVRILSSHTKSVTCIKWGGSGLLYSSSQDRTVKVWRVSDGVLCRTLEGHAHWVNTLALSTEWVIKTGPLDPLRAEEVNTNSSKEDLKALAQRRYESVFGNGERLVSGSDDFTLFLWSPESDKKPIARLTGHQQLVNDVKFSPDGRLIASASFDKSIKLWESKTGRFVGVLRGHVQAVYVISWSADSRLLVSGSADSTLKVWNVQNRKLEVELPGHADEIYAVDWSSNGLQVASGGKDKLVRLWQN